MRYLLIILSTLTTFLLLGCGAEIGDSCVFDTDCSPSGDRICTRDLPGGYCTVFGCDYDSCPDDSVCVRFFALAQTNLSCDPGDPNACSPDEFCTVGGSCVPRFSEVRYCMKTCGGSGDCREDYECRDLNLMIAHGGEPVMAPGEAVGQSPQNFCAANPNL